MVVSPMGSCSLGWPDADVAIARAAAAHGIPYTLSTMATTSLETLARRVPGRLWFQLYVLRAAHGTGLGAALQEAAIGSADAYLWIMDGNARAERT